MVREIIHGLNELLECDRAGVEVPCELRPRRLGALVW